MHARFVIAPTHSGVGKTTVSKGDTKMMKCRFWSVSVLIALLLIPALAISDNDQATKYPFTFVDDRAREVTLPSPPRRIISIGPANTEILFAIGAGGQIVGVDKFSDYPADAKSLVQVGGLVLPSFEKIVALNPDLVIFGISTDREAIDKTVSLGFNAALIAPANLNGVCEAIQLIGQITNHRSKAKEVVVSMQKRLNAVQKAVAKVPRKQRLRVFYELWPDPLRSAGPGSFIDDLIETAGGINIAGDTDNSWPLFSLETLIERDPQVILTTRKESLHELKAAHRKSWTGLTAVKMRRIVLLEAHELTLPGPRIIRGLEAIANSLYPELFEAHESGAKPAITERKNNH